LKAGWGKTLLTSVAVKKKVMLATIERGERRDIPQRKWPLSRKAKFHSKGRQEGGKSVYVCEFAGM
jgi:hypothetical protein